MEPSSVIPPKRTPFHLHYLRAVGISTSFPHRSRKWRLASRASRIRAYRAWCDKACEQFKSRGLTRSQLRDLTGPLKLTANCREALGKLRAAGVVIAVISGGIHTFLEDLFPDFRDCVDFVFINELLFAADGSLDGVRASAFDFQGKADALDRVCERVGCTAKETVFVGDHFNDEAIMLRVDKAIAYPPRTRSRKASLTSRSPKTI